MIERKIDEFETVYVAVRKYSHFERTKRKRNKHQQEKTRFCGSGTAKNFFKWIWDNSYSLAFAFAVFAFSSCQKQLFRCFRPFCYFVVIFFQPRSCLCHCFSLSDWTFGTTMGGALPSDGATTPCPTRIIIWGGLISSDNGAGRLGKAGPGIKLIPNTLG